MSIGRKSNLILIFIFILNLICVSNAQNLPIIVSTWGTNDFQAASQKAWDSLRAGHSRMRSLVEGLSECEQRQCDRTVGFGGSPDESGETTLDALLLDGPKHEMGAVGDLRRVKDAARVAWAVINYTQHSFLVGEQATKFAVEMGFSEQNLQTNESVTKHQNWLDNNCQPNFWRNVKPNPLSSCGPYKPNLRIYNKLMAQRNLYQELERYNIESHDTIGMVIIDENGDVSAGTSTNGAGNKIPGRVGDSPIPGAGAYVDNEIGGAAATGDGDIMMRFLPSYLTVEAMRAGNSPRKAAQIGIRRILKYYPNFFGAIVSANLQGEYGAACNGMLRFSYSVPTDKGTTVQSVPCETHSK